MVLLPGPLVSENAVSVAELWLGRGGLPERAGGTPPRVSVRAAAAPAVPATAAVSPASRRRRCAWLLAKTVSTGDVQIGFVYSSDLYRYDGIEQLFVVPSNTHKAIVYPGAVVAGSANADEAAKFLDFCLNDPDALKVWAQYGFELM